MSHLLIINTSITGKSSHSRQLVSTYVDKTLTRNPGISVKQRDLAEQPLPHLSGEELQAWSNAPQGNDATLSDSLIGELEWADHIVLGLPMYNFDSPSTFRVWIDRVVRAGKTFRYTEAGPEGLLTDKSVTVVVTRGGKYVGTPLDTQTSYIKNIFNFIGIQNVNFVYAEGLAMGEASAQEAMRSANEKIDELIGVTVD
ncbi:FMN-dependent NADH-azoreductase [Alteromonas sediminis]|uniref:FMN dependent NADH:quinone oxidoreductase n=1 Tax=Alteromonas sediminis TaxID=2259342 RepID=A0A3N5Y8N1_9ALTE|nr:NAD(P)H-dependent oxidoreductase [Alteromonas sediminis]RPJ67489.1 FMN-dependent NADH-azoreductase [Alteromonas sediminis]